MKPIVAALFMLLYSINGICQVIASNTCKKTPAMAARVGFSKTVVLTTSYPGKKGLVMADPVNMAKFFQDSSWSSQGYMGLFTTDDQGNVFVLPAPHVNLSDNPVYKNNYVYKIDGKTGILSVFARLPNLADASSSNAFGVLGITFHCKHQCLYISTVNGSSRKSEIGRIYQVSIESGKILDSLTQFDAYGLLPIEIDEKEYLLCGSARNSNLYQVKLGRNGRFDSEPTVILSLAGAGPRGDDRIKKIDFDSESFQLKLKGHEFNFNLSAPSDNQQTDYRFSWNGSAWQTVK